MTLIDFVLVVRIATYVFLLTVCVYRRKLDLALVLGCLATGALLGSLHQPVLLSLFTSMLLFPVVIFYVVRQIER